MKSLTENTAYILLTVITLPIVIYSYLKVVLNDDIHIFFSVARSASFISTFPMNIDIAWETRPIGNRAIFYALYKMTEPLYGNEMLFQIGVKAIVAVVVLLVSAYFAIQVVKYIKELNVYAVFLITTIALLTAHIKFLMETEWIAVIIAILCISLLLSKNKWGYTVAGILMVFIPLLKLVTVMLLPIIVITWLLIDRGELKTKIYWCFGGFIAALIAFTISLPIWFKNFIPDLILTLQLHDPTMTYSLTERIIQITFQTFAVLWYLPILTFGVYAGIQVLIEFIQTRTRLYQGLFVALWVCPLVSVFIQSEFFTYHFASLIIPSVISIFLYLSIRKPKMRHILFVAVFAVTIFIFIATCSIYNDNYAHVWDARINHANGVKEKIDLGTQPILYLDTGTSGYFLGNPSACRYTYPLVITRGVSFKLTDTNAYKEAKDCIMNYNGDYIIMFDGGTPDTDINTKISNEYVKVYDGVNAGEDSIGGVYRRINGKV